MIIWWVVSYLIGSIPLAHYIDPEVPNQSMSAIIKRNGVLAGVLVGGVDYFKGFFTVLIAVLFFPTWAVLITGLFVVTGQIFLGSRANPEDILSPDGTIIDGHISPNGVDDYFFTGDIVSITADKHILSFVDGVEVPNES